MLPQLPNLIGDDICNIFCDASIRTFPDGITVGCAGALGIWGDEMKTWNFRLIPATTNNNSEITAVYLAVQLANNAKQFSKTINVFSDSKICVFGIRHWYEGWLRNAGKDGTLYGSTGEPIANQEIFKDVMRYILQNEVKINLYHQKGHVLKSGKTLKEALEVFRVSNRTDITHDQLMYISKYNDKVDKMTKEQLAILKDDNGFTVPLKRAFSSIVTYEDVPKYKSLVGGGSL